MMKLLRRPPVLAALLLLALLLTECLGFGALGSLDWNRTRLVGRADLGVAQATLWLAGGVLPVAEFHQADPVQLLVQSPADPESQQ